MDRFAKYSRVTRSGTALAFAFLFATTLHAADPGSHKNLQLWLKADAIVDLSDGDPVSHWEDSSRAQNHGSQSQPTRRPTYRASAIGGKPAVVFDGFRSELTLPSDSVIPSLRDMDMFAVFSKGSNAGFDTLFGGGSGGDSPLFGTNSDFLTFYNSGSNPTELKSTRPVPLNTFVLVEYFKEVADVMLHMDATPSGSVRMSSGTGDIGPSRYIGGDGGSEMFDGTVAEILFFDTALSDDERLEVRCYLVGKYGLKAANAECPN